MSSEPRRSQDGATGPGGGEIWVWSPGPKLAVSSGAHLLASLSLSFSRLPSGEVTNNHPPSSASPKGSGVHKRHPRCESPL